MLVEAIKRCERCGQDKPVSHFYNSPATSDGMRSCCKACNAEKCRLQRAANKARQGFAPPREKRCPKCQEVRKASEFSRDLGSTDGLCGHCKHCCVWVHRCRRYGLPKARVLEMLEQEACEACGEFLDAKKHFDHRHSDGAVRGVLCERCNTTLGKCKENPAILMALCDYLDRTKDVDYRKQPYSVTKKPVLDTDLTGEPRLPPEEQGQCQTK